MSHRNPIIINAETRDLIHAELRADMGDAGSFEPLNLDRHPDAAADALRARDTLEGAFSMLDALGWRAGDGRDVYEVPVNERTRAWLRAKLAYVDEGSSTGWWMISRARSGWGRCCAFF